MSTRQAAARILIADDDTILRDIATAMLENAGFSVRTASSGDAAVAACAVEMPDLVLLDVEMPGGDGYQACANIRTLPGGAGVPIVMVTGLEDRQSIDRAFQAGATDFIIKPINWTLLTHRLDYVLRGARTLEALKASEQKNATLMRIIPDGICMLDAQGRIGHRFSPITGLRALTTDAGDVCLLDVIAESARAQARERLERALHGAPTALEFSVRGDDNVLRHFDCKFLPQSASQVLAILRDVTQRKDEETRMRRLAYTDPLTGLPNRQWIDEFVGSLCQGGQESGVAVMFIDLDRFKPVNDTLGHHVGDALLVQVAQRLRGAAAHVALNGEKSAAAAPRPQRAARLGGLLGRMGGDEFIAVLTGCAEIADAREVADGIVVALSAPMDLEGHQLLITASIGLALCPPQERDIRALLKNADQAMYQAKAGGGNQVRVYDAASGQASSPQPAQPSARYRVPAAAAAQVLYKPEFAADTMEIVGAQALVCSNDEGRGEVAAPVVAEVLEQVCVDLCQWRSQGATPVPVTIRVGVQELSQPDFAESLRRIVERAGVSPGFFELACPTQLLQADAEAARRALLALKAREFNVALYDFAGIDCPPELLTRVGVDCLRIPLELLDGPMTHVCAVLRVVIALGERARLRVVVQGVSSRPQLEFVRQQACQVLQGPLLSPPLGAAEFARRLKGSGLVDTLRARVADLLLAPKAG